MIDFPFLFLARIRLHSYTAFIRERHSARLLHREGALAAGQPGRWSWNRAPSSAAEGGPAQAGSGAPQPGLVCLQRGQAGAQPSGGRKEGHHFSVQNLLAPHLPPSHAQHTDTCTYPAPPPPPTPTLTPHTHSPWSGAREGPGNKLWEGPGKSTERHPTVPKLKQPRSWAQWRKPAFLRWGPF